MPKIGNVVWSERDTKTALMEKATEVGIEWDASMTKRDLVSMLDAVSDVEEEPATVEKKAPTPFVTAPIKKEEPVTPGTSAEGLFNYLKRAGEEVSYEQILRDHGPAAREALRQLISARRVTQYKRKYGAFTFKVID